MTVFRTSVRPARPAAKILIKAIREKTMSKRMRMLRPWLLIFLGFLVLPILPEMFGFGCMLVGIIVILERRWPEKWGAEEIALDDAIK